MLDRNAGAGLKKQKAAESQTENRRARNETEGNH